MESKGDTKGIQRRSKVDLNTKNLAKLKNIYILRFMKQGFKEMKFF